MKETATETMNGTAKGTMNENAKTMNENAKQMNENATK